ncbi:uncharacterized protein [Apostichopus japonicus]|uniref:uncharacterized protein isoform X2 n=2 Tax=Stichopus japonicus TaxID=307972 RepID=UPI003AB67BF8
MTYFRCNIADTFLKWSLHSKGSHVQVYTVAYNEKVKMTNALFLFATIFGFALTDGLRCYQSYSIICGSHDSIYDAVCDVFDDTNQPQSEVTCPGKCGLVTASYSYQGAFEVDFTFGTCSAGADGCLDEAQLAAQEPELEQQIKALEASGLSVNDVYACTCSGDLCNSALNIATNPVVVFFSMMVVILQAFFFN